MTVSFNTNESQNSLHIYNEYGGQMELLTLHTIKNPNHKFRKYRVYKSFQWAEDRKFSNEKIDLLVKEVRKLTFEIECLSVKFQLLHKELKHTQLRKKHA